MSDPNSSSSFPPHSRQPQNQELPQSQLARSNQLPYNIQQQQKISWKTPNNIRRNSFSSSDNKEAFKQKSPQQEQKQHLPQQQHQQQHHQNQQDLYNKFTRSEDIGSNKSRLNSNFLLTNIKIDTASSMHNNSNTTPNSITSSYSQGNIFDSNNPINILRNSSLSAPFKQQGFCRKTGKQMAEEKTNSFFQGLNSSKKISRKHNNNTSYKTNDKGFQFQGSRKKQHQRNQNQEIQEKSIDSNSNQQPQQQQQHQIQQHQIQQHQQGQQKQKEIFSREYIIDQYKKFKKLKQKLNKNVYCSPKITTRFIMQNKMKEQKAIAQAAQLNNQQKTTEVPTISAGTTTHFSMLDSLLANDELKRERQSQKITQLLELNGCSDTESLKRISQQLYEKLAKKYTDNQHLREILKQKQKILQELKGNTQDYDFDDSDEDESEFDFDLSISGNQIDSDIADDEEELNHLNQQLTIPSQYENNYLGNNNQGYDQGEGEDQIKEDMQNKQQNPYFASEQQETQMAQTTQKQDKQYLESGGINAEMQQQQIIFNNQEESRNFLVYDEDLGQQYGRDNEYYQYDQENQQFYCQGEDHNQQQQYQYEQFNQFSAQNAYGYDNPNEIKEELDVKNEPQEMDDIQVNQNIIMQQNEAIPGGNDEKNYQQNQDNNNG